MSVQNPEFDLPSPAELADLLPAYSEISFFAQGGMAAIFKGMQTSLDRPVAIKVLPREYGADDSFRLRFEAEGKAMAKLNHPNLVGIFDFGEVDGLLYIVMEFVAGETLYQHAYGNKLPELEAVAFAKQVADGLAHAHELGILHRDIKPANVLLDEKGIPKLGDFGLAEGEERAAGDDLVFGTPGYTSPEVMANPAQADEKADIFAVGVLLYELLTGTLPAEPFQPASRLVSSSRRSDIVIQKAIQPDPSTRYANASELATALRELEESLKTTPSRVLLAAGPGVPATLARGAATPTKRRPVAPKKVGPDFALLRNLIIIAGLCLAIFVAYSVLNERKQEVADEQKQADASLLLEKEKEAARRALLAKNTSVSPAQKPSTTKPGELALEPTPELSPREQLAKMQRALRGGERARYPDTTIQRAGSHYFFIPDAMGWYDAANFAEEHGAHLATPSSEEDLRWLGTHVPQGIKNFWLGGAAVARSHWAWFDHAIEFDFKEPNSALGSIATGSNYGILKAAQPEAQLPFFIQWHSDGSNPGELDSQLARLLETMDSGTPVWPPSTVALDEARYLIIGKEKTFSEAQEIAKNLQGHLAVASSELEASFLRDVTEDRGLQSLWLGGALRNSTWSWITGEPWDFGRWADDFPSDDGTGSALALSTEGWVNRDPEDSAAGFIIEWSDDAVSLGQAETQVAKKTGVELQKLQTLAQNIIDKEKTNYLAKITQNTKSLGSGIRQWIRSNSKENAASYQKNFDAYAALIDKETQRLPSASTAEGFPLPAKANELIARHFQAQQVCDFELKSATEKLRVAYVKRIQVKIKELEAKGLKAQARALQKEITDVGSTGTSFLEHFGASPF